MINDVIGLILNHYEKVGGLIAELKKTETFRCHGNFQLKLLRLWDNHKKITLLNTLTMI